MEEGKEEKKKRLTPESTILLTIGACALAIIIYRIVYFIVTGA